MATRTTVNGQTVVHKTSEGQVNTFPDVCKTQVGSAVVPIPYSNTAVSQNTSNGSKTVKVDGNPIMLKDSVFSKSTGDEAGSQKGVKSGQTGGEAKFTNYSFNVKVEGRNVCRRLDPMISNKGNTPPAPEMQPNAGGRELKDKYPLPIAFVYMDPDAVTDKISQPMFQTLHTAEGPETHKQQSEGYMGALHLSDQPGGEYTINFDEFNTEKDSYEEGQ